MDHDSGWAVAEAVAACVTAGTVLFGALLAFPQARRNRQREVSDIYVRRYWQLLDQMPESVLRGLDVGEADDRLVRLYLRLCEDQAELREEGWVSRARWLEWRGAIRAQLELPLYLRVWEEALTDSDNGQGGSFRHLRQLVWDAHYDPRPLWPGSSLQRLRLGVRRLLGLD
ncbi:hypothetical protein ABT095_18070 [Kitasatospora sp. NPDC002227]|uniref:hypothetical protein n=1 Tax=Kitasatospora sp. NPDC002227 TaxID=3154773 RepID=UPI00332763E0